ncbi:MAG: asparagine synthase-related protein [Candidatus Neomarinimicrobiota bacterium]
MIIYPKNWRVKYEELVPNNPSEDVNIKKIIDRLTEVIVKIDIRDLMFSGGVDSTIMLCLMSKVFDDISTYTISVREDHPDIIFSRVGSSIYKSNHHEFIVKPTPNQPLGDDAVRQLFIKSSEFTDSVICCDGIDEFMCGYYKHMESQHLKSYKWFLSRLLPDHLVPLNENSKDTKVYLPYLDKEIISIFSNIPLYKKINSKNRKMVTCDMARYLGIRGDFIYRNKYGFCDAFLEKDK